MSNNTDQLIALKNQIKQLKTTAEQLAGTGRDIPSVARNMSRVLASIKMLELGFVDPLEMEETS